MDPSGQTELRVGFKDKRLPLQCGRDHRVRWEFGIDQTGDPQSGPCDNGYEGYIIQFVEQWCLRTECKACNCPSRDEWGNWLYGIDFRADGSEGFSYYEAWTVTRKGTVLDTRNVTDVSTVEAIKDTCGYANQNGTVRFYCKEDVDFAGWHPGGMTKVDWKCYGTTCPTSPRGLPSIGGENPVPFWGKSPVAEAPSQPESSSSRFLHVPWNCCDKKWVDPDYGPKK